jgi:spore maturation protein SpmB
MISTQKRSSAAVKRVFRDAVSITWDLYKIMIPVIVAVKILQEMDLIQYLAAPLLPLMQLVGLPGEMGFVWAAAIVNGVYSGVILLIAFVEHTPLSTSQMTVICTMMLVAHALPVELRIAQRSGTRLPFQMASRLLGAFILGWFLHQAYSLTGTLDSSATMLLNTGAPSGGAAKPLALWAVGEVRTLVWIFFIILALLGGMRLLEHFGIIGAINRMLTPVLAFVGIGPGAATVTMIGLTLGIAYGGGLIIHQARSGTVPPRDLFYSITLMGLSHSLVEDTFLMMMMGAHISGLLLGRVVFSLIVVGALTAICRRLPRGWAERALWHGAGCN